MICDLAAAIICDGDDWEQIHCLPLQGQGACMEKGKLMLSKADKAGDESPGEDCGPPQTVGVNGQFFLAKERAQYWLTA